MPYALHTSEQPQSVWNAASGQIINILSCDSIVYAASLALSSLRVHFEILLLIWRALLGQKPDCIAELSHSWKPKQSSAVLWSRFAGCPMHEPENKRRQHFFFSGSKNAGAPFLWLWDQQIWPYRFKTAFGLFYSLCLMKELWQLIPMIHFKQ